MPLLLSFAMFLCVSGLAIRIAMLLAGHLGMLDHPGGHKQHDASTPFVGGVGVIAVVVGAMYLFPDLLLSPAQSILIGAIVLFATGLADDIWRLSFSIRFVIQATVAVFMIFLDGVNLHSLGQLAPGVDVELGPLAVPFTVFATIGLINALNMIDGIDGLSGILSVISLAFVAIAAALANRSTDLLLVIALMGSITGFLYFNLRYPGNRKARVFLGDNGSMQLGFVFAWLFIALSQGTRPAMTPVTALWFFAIPLMDTVGVMLRRIWLGKSPFHADRSHLHHLFLRAGFRVADTVWLLALTQLGLAAIGLAGLALGLPEYLMFWGFLAAFGAYFCIVARPWNCVPLLRQINTALHLPSSSVRGIFLGHFRRQDEDSVSRILNEQLHDVNRHRYSLHYADNPALGNRNVYALIKLGDDGEEIIDEVAPILAQVKTSLGAWPDIQLRHLMRRSTENDRRAANRRTNARSKQSHPARQERRSSGAAITITSTARPAINGEPHAQRV